MSREPTLGREAIRGQFHELADLIDDPTVVYLIGGGALTLLDLKNATKDIDLIVESDTELERLGESLLSAGYSPPDDLEDEYERLQAAFILEKGIRRFDVFDRQVAGVLVLSDSMKERSEVLFEEGPLVVRRASLNDIFLFKSVANREDDVDDMITLAQTGLDDDVILDEVWTQLELVGQDHFIGSMKHKLDRIDEQGYALDIHEEIERLYERTLMADQVVQSLHILMETEYADDLYEGVPADRVKQYIGSDEEAESGIDWLVETGRLERASDGSLVLIGDDDGSDDINQRDG